MPVLYLTSDIVSIQTCNQTFSEQEQVHTVSFAFFFLVFFVFATIFQGDKYLFWSPVPCLRAPSPSLSKVLAAWRIV